MPREAVDWFEIVAKLEAGDAAALLRLTGLISSILARIGAYRGGASHEDLIQEVTLALVQSVRRGAIENRDRFVGYAWSVTRNRWLNQIKAQQRRGPAAPDADAAELTAGDLAPGAPGANPGIDPGTRLDLERALGALPDAERAAIEAIYLQGRSYAEAAAELAVPLGTLKRRQWSGLRLLRERMQIDGSFA